MSEESVAPGKGDARRIQVELRLLGGHRKTLHLQEDAPALMELFQALGETSSQRVVQLPLDGGASAFSFHPSRLVAVVTEPPVVVQFEEPPARAEPVTVVEEVSRPRWVAIDDFLTPGEHHDMLHMALQSEERFERGTVVGEVSDHRNNRVFLEFRQTAHSTLLRSRLLLWYPLVAQALGMRMLPLDSVESQLTASNDGQYYRRHADAGREDKAVPRFLTMVYYFHQEPQGFAGGELRLYDRIRRGSETGPADTFHTIAPVNNRLVAFASDEWHEVMPVRCPSKEFVDSRFAVTHWLHAADRSNPDARFGWGHYRCGVVSPQFARAVAS